MSASESEHLRSMITERVRSYTFIAIANVIGVIGNTGLVLMCGPTASAVGKIAMAATIVGVVLLVALSARSIFADVISFREDLAKHDSTSSYAKELNRKPLGLFIQLSIWCNVIIAALQIAALYG